MHAACANLLCFGALHDDVSGSVVGVFEVTGPNHQLDDFGPSAAYANEADTRWTTKVPRDDTDYAHLFLGFGTETRQSSVSIQDVLSGIKPDELRLRDEVLALPS